MPKTRTETKAEQSQFQNHRCGKRRLVLVSILAVCLIAIGIASFASNNVLHGRVSISAPSEKKTKPTSSYPEISKQTASESRLTNRYGAAASSSTVAAAIRDAESKNSNVERNAKTAADRHEALQNGFMTPGADPMLAIMHGYVPPGMTQEQASILYRSVPHLPKMQRAMRADQIASMSASEIPSVFPNQQGVNATNQQILEEHFRERLGPVYLPPLHRSHTRDHQGSIREMTDASGNIMSQYSYDPYGQQTRIGGTGPDADFAYQGTYLHQRSGLLLMGLRAYSPSQARFITRDPLGEDVGVNLYSYAASDPINRWDPTGEQPIKYGNWGGEYWTNGQDASETSEFPYKPSIKKPGFVKPTTPRDRCYYWHDVGLHNCARIGRMNPTPTQKIGDDCSRRACRKGVDLALSGCLTEVWRKYRKNFGFPPTILREARGFSGVEPFPGYTSSPSDNPGEFVPNLTEYEPFDPGFMKK